MKSWQKITKIRLFEATTDFVRGFTLLTTKADFRIRNGGRLITDFVRGLKPTPFLIIEKLDKTLEKKSKKEKKCQNCNCDCKKG